MKSVLRALMDCAFFFELSEDDVVDPDAAVQQLEQIQASLLTIKGTERGAVLDALKALAQEQSTTERKEVVERFIQALEEEAN